MTVRKVDLATLNYLDESIKRYKTQDESEREIHFYKDIGDNDSSHSEFLFEIFLQYYSI